MAYENKRVASAIAGSRLWANLLQLWEYMEPERNSQQREYRIVNPDPFYSLSTDKAEAIRSVSPPQGWAKHTNVLAVSPADIVRLVCPIGERRHLRAMLPEEFKDVKISEVGRPSVWSPVTWGPIAVGAILLGTLLANLPPDQIRCLLGAVCGLAIGLLCRRYLK
jgi:hypothetical protein